MDFKKQDIICKLTKILSLINDVYIDDITPEIEHTINDIYLKVDSIKKCNNKKLITVDDIQSIPISSLYYVKNINQYAININGVVLYGNICNIYNKLDIQKNKHIRTDLCKYKDKCITLLSGKICKFYHDHVDILKLYKENIIDSSIYNIYIQLDRNFINTSWLYTDSILSKKNIHMRHLKSKNSLELKHILMKFNSTDILNEISTYKYQIIHDILVVLVLNDVILMS